MISSCKMVENRSIKKLRNCGKRLCSAMQRSRCVHSLVQYNYSVLNLHSMQFGLCLLDTQIISCRPFFIKSLDVVFLFLYYIFKSDNFLFLINIGYFFTLLFIYLTHYSLFFIIWHPIYFLLFPTFSLCFFFWSICFVSDGQ